MSATEQLELDLEDGTALNDGERAAVVAKLLSPQLGTMTNGALCRLRGES